MSARAAVAAHQRGRHRERRAWRERDLHHRILAALVMLGHHARAVGEDGILVLHHAVGRQAAIALRAVHRAARQQHAHAEPLRRRDLDIDGILEPGRKHIMMVGRGGAAGQQQFRHCDGDAEVERLRRQPRPHRVQRLAARETARGPSPPAAPGSGLIEMMMGVDQPGHHDVRAGLERDRAWRGGLLARCRPARRCGRRHDDAALGAIGENGERILDPDRRRVA